MQPLDQEQGDIIEMVYLRPGVNTLYLPLLETLDIAHFIGYRENHVLKDIALLAGDVEMLFLASPASSLPAQIILSFLELETVDAVEGSEMGEELKVTSRWRTDNPEQECDMLEIPETYPGPDPADASMMFGRIRHTWNRSKKALLERQWEEQIGGKDERKPRLFCRFLDWRR
jgi:hypothetical protein